MNHLKWKRIMAGEYEATSSKGLVWTVSGKAGRWLVWHNYTNQREVFSTAKDAKAFAEEQGY